MAKKFGVDMMSEKVYRAIQKSGKFDMDSWSWLATSADIRESGRALRGARGDDGVHVDQRVAEARFPDGGWRGVLRIPKVK